MGRATARGAGPARRSASTMVAISSTVRSTIEAPIQWNQYEACLYGIPWSHYEGCPNGALTARSIGTVFFLNGHVFRNGQMFHGHGHSF